MTGTHSARTGVILVAAGRGTRLGADVPKALVPLNGLTLLQHAFRTVTSLPWPGTVVVVAPAPWLDRVRAQISEIPVGPHQWSVSVVPGGAERHESVQRGIAALDDTIDTVLVHDAARPLTPPSLFTEVRDAVHRWGCGVIPTLPIADTLKRVTADDRVTETVPRRDVVAAQTPQGFPRAILERAHATVHPTIDVTDDADLVQRMGATVRSVPGRLEALKVTVADDLRLLAAIAAQGRPGLTAPNGERR